MQVSAWLWQKLMPARRRLRGKRPAGEPVVLQDPSDGGMLASLTDEDLQGLLGLSVLQTRKVRRELANLNQ